MIIGLDIGSSAVKVVGYDAGRVLFTHMRERGSVGISEIIAEQTAKNGVSAGEIELISATGVGAEKFSHEDNDYPVRIISEIAATGEGGTWLAGVRDAVVVSVGTGTSLVLAQNGEFTHVGGTGVGSGTVRGLAKKLVGITDLPEYFALAEAGSVRKIDIQIRDLFSGTDTLPPDLTASNLAKCGDDGKDADWAAAVINMVLEVAGSHAALACGGYGVDTVVVTGGLTKTKIAANCYAQFDRLYKPTYIIPPHSDCATAIGAARIAAFAGKI